MRRWADAHVRILPPNCLENFHVFRFRFSNFSITNLRLIQCLYKWLLNTTVFTMSLLNRVSQNIIIYSKRVRCTGFDFHPNKQQQHGEFYNGSCKMYMQLCLNETWNIRHSKHVLQLFIFSLRLTVMLIVFSTIWGKKSTFIYCIKYSFFDNFDRLKKNKVVFNSRVSCSKSFRVL